MFKKTVLAVVIGCVLVATLPAPAPAQHVPVVEIGLPDAVLAAVGKAAFDREAALAIGKKRGVQAFFVGEIEVTKVKVRLISAANGATL